jgi:predicted peptidase
VPDKLHYLLSLPEGYETDGTQRWPLVLFLHGRGERGDDLSLVAKHGIPKIAAEQADFPFIAISPQCAADMPDWTPYNTLLMSLLNEVCRAYQVDERRIYLTGLSMGGRGAWLLAVENPRRFAALAPVCGRIPDVPNFLERVCILRNMPIWVFHGALDPVVPVANSDKIVGVLQACGADVRYTIYPDADHDSWTMTYQSPELYAWFNSHKLPF